jgi:L-Ala-D/L-Glu epimerase
VTPSAILSVGVRPVRFPLRRPFVTALGRKTHSDNVLVRVRLAGGEEGWGEASSSLAMPWQTGPRMAAALRRLGRLARGRDARDLERLVGDAWKAEPETPTAVAAFECALTDALCRREGLSFHRRFGGAARELKTLMSVSAVDPASVGERVRAGRRAGFDAFKLKLNGAEPADVNLARAAAARRAAPRARFLLDPNQSYRPETADALLRALARASIEVELLEEPFPKHDWGALRFFRGRAKTPLILDESIQNPADARKVFRGRLAAGVNVKLAKSGLSRTMKILDVFARRPGEGRDPGVRRPLFMIGCMAESKVGLAAAAQFAMGTGAFDWCDLDSDLLLKPTGASGGYARRGPWLTLPKKPFSGLGVIP